MQGENEQKFVEREDDGIQSAGTDKLRNAPK